MSQLCLTPVSAKSSRNTNNSGLAGSVVTVTGWPFSVNLISEFGAVARLVCGIMAPERYGLQIANSKWQIADGGWPMADHTDSHALSVITSTASAQTQWAAV